MTQIIIKAHHVEITQSIKDYVEKKLEKMNQFFDRIQEIHVDLDIDSVSNEDARQTAAVTAYVPGAVIIAKEASRDLYSSVDGMIEKFQRQLTKHKEKVRLKNRTNAMKTKRHIRRRGMADTKATTAIEKQETKIQYYIPRPMYSEDAALILEDTSQSFLVFRDAQDEQLSVIYLAEDGHFDVLEIR